MLSQYLQQWLDHFNLFLSILLVNSCSEADQHKDIGETATINYEISHVGDDTTSYTTPQVQWLKDGLPAVHTPTNTPGTNGRLTSTLSFTFAASDAGVYQCVFTDISSSEIYL